MKKLLLILSIMVLCGCGSSDKVKIINECDGAQDKIAEFIISCSKAANPLSDEEGEDLVAQCERTAINTYCYKTEIVVQFYNGQCYSGGIATSCY